MSDGMALLKAAREVMQELGKAQMKYSAHVCTRVAYSPADALQPCSHQHHASTAPPRRHATAPAPRKTVCSFVIGLCNRCPAGTGATRR